MLLKEYIETYQVNVSAFARKAGFSITAVQNYASGYIPPLDRALKIEEITYGLVKANAEDWDLKRKRPEKKSTDKSDKPLKNRKNPHKDLQKEQKE